MALHWAMSFWADFPALSLLRSNVNTLPSTTTAFSRLASVLHSAYRSFAPYAPGSTSGSTTTRRVPKNEMVTAALINALKVVGKEIGEIHVVLNGPGSAGTAIIKMLITAGVKHIIACDENGILYKDRGVGIKDHKKMLCGMRR